MVHEAYLRLAGDGLQSWNGRGHFFAAAAEAMRRILVDSVRRKQAEKRGGKREQVHIEAIALTDWGTPDEIVAVDDALARLAEEDPEAADIFKLRVFAGLDAVGFGKTLLQGLP